MIVADTNLLVFLLASSNRTREAERVFRKDPNWIAPLIWRSEFRNAMALYVRRGLMPLAEALEKVRAAESLMNNQDFSVESVRVLSLAVSSGCSAYDCEFVALAEDHAVRLVTADEELLAKFKPVAVSMEEFCT